MSDKWKIETIKALNELGGTAHIDNIFNKIVENGNIDFSASKTPKKTLSRTLQIYSKSTDYGTDNTFYSVYGVKAHKGVWGLVDFQIQETGISLTSEDASFPEGKTILRRHIFRERNSKLIKEAKEQFKRKHNGKLYCEVCFINFEEKYGDIGKDFIEGHHIKPISEMGDNEKTNINDIVMLCSNCHSMIHRKRPWLTREDLKYLIKHNKN